MTSSNVSSLAFSSNDHILASGYSWDGQVDVWDLQTGGRMGTLKGHTNRIEFSPCGNMIATCSDSTIQIWNPFSFDCQFVMKGHHKQVWDVCWSASGSKVISGSSDGTIKVWSISDQRCSPTLTISAGGEVYSVASSPDSSLIAAGYNDGRVKVIDAATGGVLYAKALKNPGPVDSIRFLNGDQIMCLTGNRTFRILDCTKIAEVLTFKYDGWGHAISSDGTRIVSLQDNIVKIWQTDTLRHHITPIEKMLKIMKSAFTFPYHMIHGHADEVTCITFSNDGQLVASGSMDDTAKIWDTSTGQCLTTFSSHRSIVYVVTLSPDSKLCASWGWDYIIRIWKVRTGEQVSSFEHRHFVGGMSLSPGGSQLVSLSWDEVKLWDTATGDCLASMKAGFYKFTEILFSVDGSSIILRDRSDNIKRWSLSSAHNPTHTHNSTTSHLPMIFVPIQDMEPPTLPDISPNHYHYDERKPWVLDKQNRRMLWVPPESKAYFHGEKVVFGSRSGRVTTVNFPNVSEDSTASLM
jgi:WD40 repeat protein